jgi:hypothetical protein
MFTIFTSCTVYFASLAGDKTPEGVLMIVNQAVKENDISTFSKYCIEKEFTALGVKQNFDAKYYFEGAREQDYMGNNVKITKIMKYATDDENTVVLEVEAKKINRGTKYNKLYDFHKIDNQWKIELPPRDPGRPRLRVITN